MQFIDFLDRVIVIENTDADMNNVVTELSTRDIDVFQFKPVDGEADTPQMLVKNRQLIITDLMLDENVANAKTNISRLISILCKMISSSFGPYGLVVLSKHIEHLELLKELINISIHEQGHQEDAEEFNLGWTQRLLVPPVFVIALNKNNYIESGSYEALIPDIEKELSNNTAGAFFINWCSSAKKAINKSVLDIYSICDNYISYDKEISYILYRLAQNHTGNPSHNEKITADCYKAFDELMYSDLFVQQKEEKKPSFATVPKNPWVVDKERQVIASINSKFFLDFDAISQHIVVPGNVYKIKTIIPYSISNKALKEVPVVEKIAIELTPPCDFANHKKVISRVLLGCAFPEPSFESPKKRNAWIDPLTKDCYYLCPNLEIDGRLYVVVFDFRCILAPASYELQEPSMYKIWFRAKPKLFADILQKFSSHASRLGLSSLDVYKK